VVLIAAALLVRWIRRRAVVASVEARKISAEELYQLMAGGPRPTILDVRGALARDISGAIPGARFIELDTLGAMAPELGSGVVVVYCNCPNEVSALKAASILEKQGIDGVRVLVGGYDGWKDWVMRKDPSDFSFN
jgi:rhodanese-related sulfurtransferase